MVHTDDASASLGRAGPVAGQPAVPGGDFAARRYAAGYPAAGQWHAAAGGLAAGYLARLAVAVAGGAQ